ncbi:integrin alpha-4, partial [Biomphalaria glabrata]
MWSRFGHCLGVVNINNNPYDDLLVGAPLYTEWSDPDHVPDQGMVFIYHYSEQSKKYEQENVFLDGSKLPYARFGSALTDIGDINLDGFVDIAVGAPGETDGAGSIYIYLGSTNGFVNVPSQRIQASQISSTLRGFGFAFSNKQVPPNKKYPVFAATSVLSETVVVFTYKSIVDVEATLTATPNPVNTTLPSPCNTTDSRELQETCIQVKFCLRYTIRGETFRAINFSIQLDIDTKIKAVNNKRSMFTTNNNQFMETVKTYLKVGTENEDECSKFEAVLRKAQINKDRFTPIIIVANFSIEPLQNATNDLTLDETKAKNRTLEVTFVKDCGPDAKCEVDLSVNATFTLQPSNTRWTHLVVNLTQEINLKIVIKNKNDPSYGTVAMIELDSYVPFIKAKSDRNCVIGATNSTDISFTTDKLGICCIFYEPLENTGEISFDISFQIDEVDLTRDLKATIEVKPNSPEYNPEIYSADNSYVVEAPLYIVASIALESSSTPPEHIIYDAKNSSSNAHDEEQSLFNVTHKILIRNNGPSFLPKTEILVEVPMYLFNETQLVTSTDVKMSTPSGEVHCHSNADIDPNFVETTTLE